MHKPIIIDNLNLAFPGKLCFDDFSAEVLYGARIAVIGRNGSGKSALLKLLRDGGDPAEGGIALPDSINIGYVPQTIHADTDLSGGQRFNHALTQALAGAPDILLLDEPTNHLDRKNRAGLMRMLRHYDGTLIVATHDTALLRQTIDTLWHIDRQKIHSFHGNYDNYMQDIHQKKATLTRQSEILQRAQKDSHNKLMREQQRAAKSRAKGKKSIRQRKWATVTSPAKTERAMQTPGNKQAAIAQRKAEISRQLEDIRLPQIIEPRFSLTTDDMQSGILISVCDGTLGYRADAWLLRAIHFSLAARERIAITGNNGSGKSTLLKTMLGHPSILKSGDWQLPRPGRIGYLDQHYDNLPTNKTVLETLSDAMPHGSPTEIRRHLHDFLFHDDTAIQTVVNHLSGGEKARLSLAWIAADTPHLLLLDEITNNLDLETKTHVIQVLNQYPGALLVISHDDDFLQAIGIDRTYHVADGTLKVAG